MTAQSVRYATLKALRDFFASRDENDMSSAMSGLSKLAPQYGLEAIETFSAAETEYAFNRLFIGPGPVAAPLFASAYLEPDGRLMGDATRQASSFYSSIGFASPFNGSLPEDHLSLELDAALICADSNEHDRYALWKEFLRSHLGSWLPRFLSRLEAMEDLPATLRLALAVLAVWLREETSSKPHDLSTVRPTKSGLKRHPKALLVEKGNISEQDETGARAVFRNVCPRNCYDSCAMVSHVENGAVTFIEGAPESSFTKGGLCVKGYAYLQQVYSLDRLKYPMQQIGGRGSGKWKRLSWDDAIGKIADKILEMKDRDGSLLALALTKYSGNFGITNYGVEGMMSSLGYTTRLIGTPCWPAGIDAQNYDMGGMWCNDPEDLCQARYIILWGANPAWCSPHSMKYIFAAQKSGAKLVVIDPLFTQTAAKADVYIQIQTGEDGALALGMCRHILDLGLQDDEWLTAHSLGFGGFADYLKECVTLDWASKQSGVPIKQIEVLAEEFAKAVPATIWIGLGLQRHVNGGATVRILDALVAMTGNIGKPGGGARYGHLHTWGFNYHAMAQKPPADSRGWRGISGPKGEFDFTSDGADRQDSDRCLNINRTAQEILDAKDPPIRMLWVASKNVLSQDFDRPKLLQAFEKLEFVVVADMFFNQTAELADIVLPVTTLFEQWTVNVSYWHYWIGLNEQAIKPLHESKSDLQIAAALSRRLNQLAPGSCTFPTEVNEKEWMAKEFNQGILDMFGLNSWEDLRRGPAKARLPSSAAWPDGVFATPSKKYEFHSELCQGNGHHPLPAYSAGRRPYDKLRLLTPHHNFGIHSQFQNLDWIAEICREPFVHLNPKLADLRGIRDGDRVIVTNNVGKVRLRARTTDNVPDDTLVIYEAWFKNLDFNCQNLVDDMSSDMGAFKTGAAGAAIHDQFADIFKDCGDVV